MNVNFFVRPWNVNFFISLNKLIECSNNKYINTAFFMNRAEFNKYSVGFPKSLYLPDMMNINDIIQLDELEKFDRWLFSTYGFGIYFLFEMERFKPDCLNVNKFIEKHFFVLFNLIQSNSINICLSCDHFVFILSSYIARYKSAKFIFVQPVGFPLNAQVILSNPFERLKIRDFDLSTDFLYQFIESLNSRPESTIHYMAPQKNISLFSSMKNYLKNIKYNSYSDYEYLNPKKIKIWPSRFNFNLNKRINLNRISINEFNKFGKVFYYPLQFEPEMTISVYSPFFISQLEFIRMISSSLKLGDVLVLKENPKQISMLPTSFYNSINNFSNVKWIDETENSRDIIRESYKVLTISGTAAIEATMLGVNTSIIGFPPFACLLKGECISALPLKDFTKTLYTISSPNELIEHASANWGEYSKSIFFADLTPRYINNKFTMGSHEDLALKFFNDVFLYIVDSNSKCNVD